MTVISMMTDYAKFCGFFRLHYEVLLEDCSFMLNLWVFSIMVKFVPIKWMRAILNFKKNPSPQNPTSSFIESLHNEFVFKVRFKHIKKFLYNFNAQLETQNSQVRSLFFEHMQLIQAKKDPLSTRELIVALKSLEFIFQNFQHLDPEKEVFNNKSLF